MCDLGYEASLDEDGGEVTIEAQNCVYHELAQAAPAVCALDLALIGALADAAVDHRSCMARGDEHVPRADALELMGKRRRVRGGG